eukprot:7376746-Prymnesium_polylepis.3
MLAYHLYVDVHRLHEAYFLDAQGQPQSLSNWQCLQYLFVHHNIVLAIGIFCVVIAFALLGFWGYHVYLVRRCRPRTRAAARLGSARTNTEKSRAACGRGAQNGRRHVAREPQPTVETWHRGGRAAQRRDGAASRRRSRRAVGARRRTAAIAERRACAPAARDEARRKGEADPKKKAKALMPPNIYSRGFWRNVYEVLYPLSSRPVQGFKQARQVGGAMLGFAPRLDGKPRADEADTEGDESSDEAQPVDASAHPHAD